MRYVHFAAFERALLRFERLKTIRRDAVPTVHLARETKLDVEVCEKLAGKNEFVAAAVEVEMFQQRLFVEARPIRDERDVDTVRL